MTSRALTNTIAFLLMLMVNFLANALPIGNGDTGDIAARYDNLFVPAGYTFSIWLVIYLLLGYFILRQWRDDELVYLTGLEFPISCALNIAWLFAWHYEMLWLSLVIMVALLITLIGLYSKLRPYYALASGPRFWAGWAPFAIYLGWISVATMANAAAFLVSRGLGDMLPSPRFWTAFLLTVGVTIGGWMVLHHRGGMFALALVWAYTGIAVRLNGQEEDLFWLAVVMALFLFVVGSVSLRSAVRS